MMYFVGECSNITNINAALLHILSVLKAPTPFFT